jgi:hypothetical protein
MCKGQIYKIKIDNTTISAGSGLTRYNINLSNFIQDQLTSRPSKIWVETAQLTSMAAGAGIASLHVAIASNITQRNTYNNTINNGTNVLCYLPSERKVIAAGVTEVISLNNPTEPTICTSIPPSLELWLTDAITQAVITLPSAAYQWYMVLCIQTLDDEDMPYV